MATRSELLVERPAQAEESLTHAGRPGVLRALLAQRTAVVGLAIVGLMGFVAIAAPVLAYPRVAFDPEGFGSSTA